MHHHPSIAVSIATSSPVLDLSKHDPFTITITITLDYPYPITFDKRFTSLFDGKALYEGGLSITNTSTKEQLARNSLSVCYDTSDEDGTPSEQSKDDFTTLFPGKDRQISVDIKPFELPVCPTSGFMDERLAEKQMPKKAWKWSNVSNLEDGQSYELGVSQEAVVRRWFQGSVAGVLEMKRLGLKPSIKNDVVRFTVRDTARFAVRRPDKDGSLNWP
jgi:hypothetical protein